MESIGHRVNIILNPWFTKDVFKRTADLRISQKRQRKESVEAGFYTIEAMKTELKFNKNLGFNFLLTQSPQQYAISNILQNQQVSTKQYPFLSRAHGQGNGLMPSLPIAGTKGELQLTSGDLQGSVL